MRLAMTGVLVAPRDDGLGTRRCDREVPKREAIQCLLLCAIKATGSLRLCLAMTGVLVAPRDDGVLVAPRDDGVGLSVKSEG